MSIYRVGDWSRGEFERYMTALRTFNAAPVADEFCECDADPVPGALIGMNDRDEIQCCDECARFDTDGEAAQAVADAIGGDAVVIIDHGPDLQDRDLWLVIERDGARLTADHIRQELTP